MLQRRQQLEFCPVRNNAAGFPFSRCNEEFGTCGRGLAVAVVFLVRHAAHVELGKRLTGRKCDVELSEEGERQARALAARMARESLAAIYTSPRLRARRTAAAIAGAHGLEVEVASALDELDFGDWTGASFEDLGGDPVWRRWNEARETARPPNGETMAAAIARIVAHIDEVAAVHSSRPVALISHCDMIRGAIAQYLGLPLNNLLRFDIEPASISTVEVGEWGARVTGLNEKATV